MSILKGLSSTLNLVLCGYIAVPVTTLLIGFGAGYWLSQPGAHVLTMPETETITAVLPGDSQPVSATGTLAGDGVFFIVDSRFIRLWPKDNVASVTNLDNQEELGVWTFSTLPDGRESYTIYVGAQPVATVTLSATE